jgi:hypothetical protein
MHGRPLPRVFPVSFLVDEQGKNATFVTKDAFVQGGGVIHSINAVSLHGVVAQGASPSVPPVLCRKHPAAYSQLSWLQLCQRGLCSHGQLLATDNCCAAPAACKHMHILLRLLLH